MENGSAAPDAAATPKSDIGIGSLDKNEMETLALAFQEDITLLCDEETRIFYISDSVTSKLGYDPDKEIGRLFSDFIFPEDLERIATHWQRFVEGFDDHPIQFRACHSEGQWIWFEARSKFIEHPTIKHAIVINLREIEHHQRLRQHADIAQKAAKFGTWRWNLKDESLQWSNALYSVFGYEPHSGPVDLEWMINLFHKDDQTRLADLVASALKNPAPFQTTARVRAGDGSYRTAAIHAYVEVGQNGDAQALVGVNQDITAQIRAENDLRKSEQDYRLLAEESSDLILRYNAKGYCTFTSAACEHILGYTNEEAMGANALEFVFKPDRNIIEDVYAQSLSGNTSQRVTYRAHKKNGDLVWLEASIRTIFDHSGNVSEIIVVARDVTERQANQEELELAHEKAEAANHTKSRFLANMSHELRTPLNAIIGFSDIMCEEMFGPLGAEQYTDYSKLIRESGQFLLALINDILDMSKIEAGKYDLFLENLNLEEIIVSCLRIVEQSAAAEAIDVTCSLEEGLPPVYADGRTVKQIFLNLLSNAVKFTPEGGSLHVSAERDGGMVAVSIKDSGCGIPAEDLPRLAQPFEQVNSEATHAQSGTGLGLALVKSFVTLHGGTLCIKSDEGKGTCVCFSLPFSAQDGAAQDDAASA